MTGRYVARLETFDKLDAASALALRYGQLSEPVLTALASDDSDANPQPSVMRGWLRLATLFQLAYEAPPVHFFLHMDVIERSLALAVDRSD